MRALFCEQVSDSRIRPTAACLYIIFLNGYYLFELILEVSVLNFSCRVRNKKYPLKAGIEPLGGGESAFACRQFFFDAGSFTSEAAQVVELWRDARHRGV